MSKHRVKLAIIATLVLGAFLCAEAQGGQHASIPFDFVVSGATFPAGTYSVVSTSSPQVVLLRNDANPRVTCLLQLQAGERLSDGNVRLVLQRKTSVEHLNEGQK